MSSNMDDQMTQTPSHPIVDMMPTQSSLNTKGTSSRKPLLPSNKKRLVALLIILVVVILAVVGWYLWKKHQHAVVTPAQSLEDLRLSSGPDTKTTDQKSATMSALEKSSKKSTLTSQQQLDMLNSLQQ